MSPHAPRSSPAPAPSPAVRPRRRSSRDRPTVLLTGAAGVLGRALLEELLVDHDVVCMRHRTPLGDPRVREVKGNLLEPRLGMTRAERFTLASEVDLVVHSAAATSWQLSPENIHRTNVQGTEAVIDIAERAEAPVYYMSTAFVANPLSAADRERFPGAAAYLASKTEAERRLRDARVPGVILRPSVVMGDSCTGQIAGAQGLTTALAAIVLGQVPVVPGAPGTRIDCVPQDYLARATVDLMRSGVTEGEFWLTAGKRALVLHDIVRTCADFAEHLGLPRPTPPRLLPVESVHRLLMPLLDGTALPARTRKQFRNYAELLLVFQRALPFETDLGRSCGTEVTEGVLQDALLRNLESWADDRSGMISRIRRQSRSTARNAPRFHPQSGGRVRERAS
ncbi:SDR family oxidoreductase [Streptomyces sp. DSM 42041]|uniref:SDR family oxidoreductase n=1 Tax=Streptomyces hazeniae TaxID=3075538 RepID=A0ABU2NU80_9ACTN|nr:SDR family oxidoreductase [Streptomyces sp. DSM 42041]MDT0380546.1 SDR family oxidoreductase [Streptomyces sp. DSM 42041]